MPVFRVTCRDESAGAKRTVYIDAPSEHAARAHLSARGFFELRPEPIDPAGRPPDQTLVRVAPAESTPAPELRPLRKAALGVALGLFIILGVLFVARARQHLLRTDLRPNEPPRATADTNPSTPSTAP